MVGAVAVPGPAVQARAPGVDHGGAARDRGSVHQPKHFRGRGRSVSQPTQRGLHQRRERLQPLVVLKRPIGRQPSTSAGWAGPPAARRVRAPRRRGTRETQVAGEAGNTPATPSAPRSQPPAGCRRAGEGWAEGPSRRDAERPSGAQDSWHTAAGRERRDLGPQPVRKKADQDPRPSTITNGVRPGQRPYPFMARNCKTPCDHTTTTAGSSRPRPSSNSACPGSGENRTPSGSGPAHAWP